MPDQVVPLHLVNEEPICILLSRVPPRCHLAGQQHLRGACTQHRVVAQRGCEAQQVSHRRIPATVRTAPDQASQKVVPSRLGRRCAVFAPCSPSHAAQHLYRGHSRRCRACPLVAKCAYAHSQRSTGRSSARSLRLIPQSQHYCTTRPYQAEMRGARQ